MKVKVFGSGAGYGPDGVMTSWAPNQIVEVDDRDKKAVAFYRRWVDIGSAELIEEPTSKPAPAPDTLTEPPKAGPGSGRAAWVEYAESLGLDVHDMSRDDIVEVLEDKAG